MPLSRSFPFLLLILFLLRINLLGATLTWTGGQAGLWINGGGGWTGQNGPTQWNSNTPDAAIFGNEAAVNTVVDASGVRVESLLIRSGSASINGPGVMTLTTGVFDIVSSATIAAGWSGTNGITKRSEGILYLSGSNKNHSGASQIFGGAIEITAASAGIFGSGTTSAITLNGGALHTRFSANTSINYHLTIGTSGGELRNSGAGRFLFTSNKLSGNGPLTLSFGSGGARFTGATQGSFSGLWILDGNGGNSANAFMDTSAANQFGTGSGTDLVTLKNGARILMRGYTLSGTQGVVIGAGGGAISTAGGASSILASRISGEAENTLELDLGQSLTSSITLSNTANSWLGPTKLSSQGILRLGNSEVIPNTGGHLQISSSSIWDLNGFSESIGGLTGTGAVDNRAPGSTSFLTVGLNQGDCEFAGSILDSGVGASLHLIKRGTGSLTLSGSTSIAGWMEAREGNLALSSTKALGNSKIALSGGTLRFNGFGLHEPTALILSANSVLDLGTRGATVHLPAPEFSENSTLQIANWGPGRITFSSPPTLDQLSRIHHATQPTLTATLASDGTLNFAGADLPGLQVVGGKLFKNGSEFRGIGVNYYDAFNRVLTDGTDGSYTAGFEALAIRGIPFVRLDVSGYWPVYLKLYRDDPEEYFTRLDRVVAAAERTGVGLIPSLFWTTFAVPDLVGESLNKWGQSESATRAFMRQMTRDLVTRYRYSPAILAWEFGNEWNLAVDLPNASEHRPPTYTALGNPTLRTAEDDLTTAMLRPALVEFANLVRQLDYSRPLSTGHSMLRTSQWHQYQWSQGLIPSNQAWATDSTSQTSEMLLWLNPAPYDLLSIHAYSETPSVYPNTAQTSGKVLFVGEFGASGTNAQQEFQTLLQAAQQAPLAAIWVYDRSGDPFNVTPLNDRSWILDLIDTPPFALWSSNSAPTSDPDGNGFPLLTEYALGSVRAGTTPLLPTTAIQASKLVLKAVVRTDDPTLSIIPEWADSVFGPWRTDGIQTTVLPSPIPVPSGCQPMSFSVPSGLGASRFLRLKITYNME